jgi:hypothetical protein
MKNGSLGTKVLVTVVSLVVLSYFGIQAYHYFASPFKTSVAYTYQVEESASATGYVVRNEQVLPSSGDGLLRLSRSEGERVSAGGVVATVYADQASLDQQNDVDSCETQIAQLEYAKEAAAGSEVSLKLDSQIMQDILDLRGDLTADRLEAADASASSLRALVLKRDYTYSDTDDVSAKLTELQSQLKTLQSKAASSTKKITAPESGLYSAEVDGYETVLTPKMLDGLTPAALAAVKADESVSSDVGKLILGDTWYYAATMTASDAADLTAGKSVTLRFAKDANRDLSVRVVSVSDAENGRAAVVFSSRQYLSELTLLRRQSADVIRASVTGIRVPSQALRVNADGQSGLYCVVGVTARFKPVSVLYSGDGFVLVKGESDAAKDSLRPGDEVIISAGQLSDGEVIR